MGRWRRRRKRKTQFLLLTETSGGGGGGENRYKLHKTIYKIVILIRKKKGAERKLSELVYTLNNVSMVA